MMIDEVNKFAETVIKCTNMEDLMEELLPLINNPAPGVKTGTVKFVENLALVTYIDVLQRTSDDLMKEMLKVIDDKDGGVRDAALHCMGILKGRLKAESEKYLKNVNSQKMAKIDEAAQEVKTSKYDRPENWKPPPPKKAPAPPK